MFAPDTKQLAKCHSCLCKTRPPLLCYVLFNKRMGTPSYHLIPASVRNKTTHDNHNDDGRSSRQQIDCCDIGCALLEADFYQQNLVIVMVIVVLITTAHLEDGTQS